MTGVINQAAFSPPDLVLVYSTDSRRYAVTRGEKKEKKDGSGESGAKIPYTAAKTSFALLALHLSNGR